MLRHRMPLIVLAAALLCGAIPWHNTQSRTQLAASASKLAPLACSGCTVHLVADDWDGSSATWPGRVGGVDATKRGTPTKGASAFFPGRFSIQISAAGACMTVPSDNYAVGQVRSYEILVDDWGTGQTGKALASRHEGSFVQLSNLLYKNDNDAFSSAVYVSGAGTVYIGTEATAYTDTEGKPIAWTITMDLSVPRLTVYRNGTQIYQDTTTSGSLTATAAQALGLGCRWNQSAASDIFGGKILEFMRHDTELSGATVAARLAVFNSMKGY